MKKHLLFIFLTSLTSIVLAQPQADLFAACFKGDLVAAKKAVELGADVNDPDPKTGQTALAYAAFWPDLTGYLLSKGADPNGGSFPAIITAANLGSLEVMRLLLDNGADPNRSVQNMYALTQSIKSTNCDDCVDLLLSKGAQKTVTEGSYGNIFGVFAAYAMSEKDRRDALRSHRTLLKGYGLTIPDWYQFPDSNFIASPDAIARVLVKHGIDINKRDTLTGETPLHTAIRTGGTEVVLSLLKNGADYNARFFPAKKGITLWDMDGGYTPLMYACVEGNVPVVQWLLQQPDVANVSIAGNSLNTEGDVVRMEGISALYLAIVQGDATVVQLLASSPLKWGDLHVKTMPGEKYDSSKAPKERILGFMPEKKHPLIYSPSLFADMAGRLNLSLYLSTKGL